MAATGRTGEKGLVGIIFITIFGFHSFIHLLSRGVG